MRVLAAVVGQSNEAGSLPTADKDRTGGVGAPHADPIYPNTGSYGSWWPRVASLVGKRGHWLQIYNTAVGSTCLTESWVGRCRDYAVSMVVAHGAYVLDGGNVYKAVGAASTVYTLNVAPSAGVGTSGLTSWTNLGAATAEDTNGAVYTSGNSRFDPLGYLAAIVAAFVARPGYDKKIVLVSIGQGDKTVSSTAAQYSAAMQAVVGYFTPLGYEVYLGFTCYGATAGLDAYYTSDLLPGYTAALAATAANSLVKTGANLRSALGVLATSPASGPGLQADAIHINTAAAYLAAEAWDSAFLAAGF